MYNGESTVNERNCEDFLNTLKKHKIFKVKPTGKTNKIWCIPYNCGFYKTDPGCMFNQPDVDCGTHIRVKS